MTSIGNKRLWLSLVALAGASALSLPAYSQQASTGENSLSAMLPDNIREAGKVTLATDASFGPPWFYQPEGEIGFAGIDYDLITAAVEKLGIEVQIESLGFQGIIPGLSSGRYDIAMVGMSLTAERTQQIDMIGYVIDGNSIVVKAGNPLSIQTLDDLCGHPVAAATGTFQLTILEEQSEKCGDNPMQISRFPTKQDTFLQIRSGRAVATMDGYAVSHYLQTHSVPGSESIEPVATQSPERIKALGIGLRKNNDQLRDALQAALQKMVEDGTYLEILEKWGIKELALETISINDPDLDENPHLKADF
ncbi:ABC transporter substrate-binding protein [Nitratireductor indicus]|uniref:ABC transporter substrate-binding protein n=1 Tax=Nitratireductor indicus TaxID=721133 RepID=UPI0028747D22|nr:ABC transporter substrate-binding protein [Nitratireductor indicus]MDS1138777.1 ABC transporter substrate-binding protein [Nitratireductor indicus]